MNTTFKETMKIQYNLLKGMYMDEVIENEKCDFYKSHVIKDNFWNFVTGIKTSISEALPEIEETFKIEDKQPCIYLNTDENTYRDYSKCLVSNGYTIQDQDVFMFLANNNLKGEMSFKYKETNNIELLSDFMEVLNDAFGGEKTEENPYSGAVDETYQKAIKESLEDTENKFHHLVIYDHNDKPVSCATLTYKDGWGGIYNVGTKQSEQNKGYGKEIMKVIISKFEELGGGNLYLFTEKDSKNEMWYKKIGFETKFVNNQFVKE